MDVCVYCVYCFYGVFVVFFFECFEDVEFGEFVFVVMMWCGVVVFGDGGVGVYVVKCVVVVCVYCGEVRGGV